MLMVSKAQVLSARRPDFRDIITRHASGVTKYRGKGEDIINIHAMHETEDNKIREKGV